MNGFQAQASSSKDRRAIALRANFYKASGSQTPSAGRHCAQIVKSTGSNPSYAMCGIPLKDVVGPGNWDKTPGVALCNGFANDVRLLSRASCGYTEGRNSVTLLNGWVVSHGHNIKEDSIVTQIFDDRHIMASYYTCFGKMVYDHDQSKHCFISNPNDPLVFNRWGFGDCLDSPFGKRFATGHRYGHLSTNEVDPSDDPSPGSATSKTRKWTVIDILGYLREFFYDVIKRPPLIQDFGELQLPRQYLEWPENFGKNIVENKIPQNFSLQSCNLLEAITKTLTYAGPYELALRPISSTKSRLEVVDHSKRANTGIRIFSPKYFGNDLAAVADNPNVARDGHIKQSALGYAHNVVQVGDAPCIEFMASTDPADSDCASSSLLFGWTEEEENAFKARVAQADNAEDDIITGLTGAQLDGDRIHFEFACKETLNVFNYYRINPRVNPFLDSKLGQMAQSGNFRILPHQLTSYNSNPTSPLGLIRREIVIEIKMTDWEYARYQATLAGAPDLGPWRVAYRQSEAQLSPCGRYIALPSLRDVAGQDSCTWVSQHLLYLDETPSQVAAIFSHTYMKARHVRIQVVAQSDHALVSRRGHDVDVNNTAQYIDPDAPKFSLLLTNEPMQYIDYLRGGGRFPSYPMGIGGYRSDLKLAIQADFQPAQAQGEELFTDHVGDGNLSNPKNRLDNHTQKDVENHKRITWEGVFIIGRLTPVYDVGQFITYEAPNGLPDVGGIVKCIVLDNDSQTVKVEIGPPSFSTIWDGPMQTFLGSSGGVSESVTQKEELPKPSDLPSSPPPSTNGPIYKSPSNGINPKARQEESPGENQDRQMRSDRAVKQAVAGEGGAAGGAGAAGAAGSNQQSRIMSPADSAARDKALQSPGNSREAAPNADDRFTDENKQDAGRQGILSESERGAKDDAVKSRWYGKGQEGRTASGTTRDVRSVSGDQKPGAGRASEPARQAAGGMNATEQRQSNGMDAVLGNGLSEGGLNARKNQLAAERARSRDMGPADE